MSNNVWIDGQEFDYADIDMPLGGINCARVDHGLTEAVDPETGLTHAIDFGDGYRQWRARPTGDAEKDAAANEICPLCMGQYMRGKDTRCRIHYPPSHPGMCMVCWIRTQDGTFSNCPLHGVEKKIDGLIGCPICALDPLEKQKCDEHIEKMAEIAAVREVDPADAYVPPGGGGPEASGGALITGHVTEAMMRNALRQRAGR